MINFEVFANINENDSQLFQYFKSFKDQKCILEFVTFRRMLKFEKKMTNFSALNCFNLASVQKLL